MQIETGLCSFNNTKTIAYLNDSITKNKFVKGSCSSFYGIHQWMRVSYKVFKMYHNFDFYKLIGHTINRMFLLRRDHIYLLDDQTTKTTLYPLHPWKHIREWILWVEHKYRMSSAYIKQQPFLLQNTFLVKSIFLSYFLVDINTRCLNTDSKTFLGNKLQNCIRFKLSQQI